MIELARRRRYVLACACGALLACASGPRLNTPPQATPYRIGPEDLLEIVVWNNDTVSRRVPVRPDGMISLPLVNDVRAAGLTPLELRDALARAFSKYIPDPEVYVIVQEVNSPKVLVMGEVAHPGRYVIKGPTTLYDVVAEAGGLTEFATGSRATLVRNAAGRTERFRVDARADSADSRATVALQPGDILIIP